MISNREKPPEVVSSQFQPTSRVIPQRQSVNDWFLDSSEPCRFDECALQHLILRSWLFLPSLPAWNQAPQAPRCSRPNLDYLRIIEFRSKLRPRCSKALLETTNPDPEYSQTINVKFGENCPIKIPENSKIWMAAQKICLNSIGCTYLDRRAVRSRSTLPLFCARCEILVAAVHGRFQNLAGTIHSCAELKIENWNFWLLSLSVSYHHGTDGRAVPYLVHIMLNRTDFLLRYQRAVWVQRGHTQKSPFWILGS